MTSTCPCFCFSCPRSAFFIRWSDFPSEQIEDQVPPLESVSHPYGPLRSSPIRRRRRRRRRFADRPPVIDLSIDSSSGVVPPDVRPVGKTFFMDTGDIIDHYIYPGTRNNIKFHFGNDLWVWESLVHEDIKQEYYERIGMTRDRIFSESQLESHSPMPFCCKCQRVYVSRAAGEFDMYHCDCWQHHTICGTCRKQKQFARYKCQDCKVKLHQKTPMRYHRQLAVEMARNLQPPIPM